MVETRNSGADLVEVQFGASHSPGLPVEVVDRSELLERKKDDELPYRQRVGFHILYLVTCGSGMHHVDFEPVEMKPGTVLHIHPGQVQRFQVDPPFEALMLLWRIEFDPEDPEAPRWFPGSDAPTRWHLPPEALDEFVGWVEELRGLQHGFEGQPRQLALLRCLLQAILLRLALETPDTPNYDAQFPAAYVDFRELLEERLYDRPTVAEVAESLGYSTRTLDRACQAVVGKTAKAVLDERVALELKRLLTHTRRPVTRIGLDFGFTEASNFSKFVRRHLGQLPTELRNQS